ncbi:pentatricopeptide repeat-containing protein At1g80270, mitochondrial-like [Oryza brachyantha]|uniref:PROP1-like PPR domain-containing protein n=1 Tax=Oryza brachyantha TaxID=4533 RepID=J3MJH0_ORYBR|nr:pentatricopeptide repeat-containing protein At1g80270, mitochondrial-like [Oryza brachyantha]
MWPSLRRAAAGGARLKNVSHLLPVSSGFKDGNLCGSWSGVELPFGLDTVFPSIRRLCSEPAERPFSSRNGGDILGQDESDLPDGNLETDGEADQQNGRTDEFKLSETKTKNSGPQFLAVDHSCGTDLQDKTYKPFLYKVVFDAPSNNFSHVLDKWIEDGNRLERNEVMMVLFHLRKQHLYRKALQFVEWMERGKLLNYEERDYACHLDLVARTDGIENAQKYIKRVPLPFRNEVLYETLLVNCVRVGDIQKAEEVFKEIKDLRLRLTLNICNQMILLYKRIASGKVADILMLMEKGKIEPSAFTYKLLIDLKGRSNDLAGIELVLNEMKACGIEPSTSTQSMVAMFYMRGGLIEKAEAVVKKMEVQLLESTSRRHAIRSLLHLYAALNKPDDVARIWKFCTEPNLEDFLAAIKAWAELGHIEQAEETFEEMANLPTNISSKYYIAMLNVYAHNKLLAKGKQFVERMCRDGCPAGPLTWDALINLYVNSGEVEKADSFLLKVAEENPDRRPLFTSYVFLMKGYAKRGDIHNTEKIFDRLKKGGYPAKSLHYGVLLEAYVNAKAPAHGFLDRMRGDNVRPSIKLRTQLRSLGTSQKGRIAELD